MNKNTIFTSIVTAAIVAVITSVLALAQFSSPKQITDEPTPTPLGSSIETTRVVMGAGVDVIPGQRDGGLIFKGALAITSTAANTFLAPLAIVGNNTLFVTPTVPATSLILPASTTFPQAFLPRAGDRTSIVIFNASSTTGGGSTMGLAPGAGSLIQVASTTPAGTASTTGTTFLNVTIVRKPNTDLLFLVSPFK